VVEVIVCADGWRYGWIERGHVVLVRASIKRGKGTWACVEVRAEFTLY
jgi:hypothetical protein